MDTIHTSLKGVHSALAHSWSNAITSWSQDFDRSYISSEGHQVCRFTSLKESKESSLAGDTDIIIPWSRETNKSLYIEFWRGKVAS